MRLTKLSNNHTLIQVHATQDSHYAILPVLERASAITGWVIYDTTTGEVIGDSELRFTDVLAARTYLEGLY